MVAIPFPLSSSPGGRPQEGAGRLVNVYAEPRGEDLGPVWRRAPGLGVFAETGESEFRGAIVMPGVVYLGFKDVILAMEQAGISDGGVAYTTSFHGSMPGTDKLFFARNNNSVPDVVVVGDAGPKIVTSTGVEDYPDPDVGAPNAVAQQSGYFFFTYGDGKCRTSGINTTDINANDLATAEQHPDGLLRPVPFRSMMLLCGWRSIEVWSNTGNPEGFPYSYSHLIPAGLAGPHAIAGGTDEFSEFLLWVADDSTVRRLDGWNAAKVSSPDLDRLIEALPDKTVLEACCYASGGHKFWQLSCPDWTWAFDLNTNKWHERDSHLQKRSRITQAFPVGGAWTGVSAWLCGDILSGKILEINRRYYDEVGEPLRALVESGSVKNFPNRIHVSRADFDVVVGVGIATGQDPIATDPGILISWSNDGGIRWSNPVMRKLGRQQEGQQRVSVLRTGLSGPVGRKWRLEVLDPVHFGLIGGDQEAEARFK